MSLEKIGLVQYLIKINTNFVIQVITFSSDDWYDTVCHVICHVTVTW